MIITGMSTVFMVPDENFQGKRWQVGTGGMNLVPLTATRQTTESVSGKRQIKKKKSYLS